MSNTPQNTFTLTTQQMQQLARYEITFKDICDSCSPDESLEEIVPAIVPVFYAYTLEDLKIALENLSKKDPVIDDFRDDWFYPILDMEEYFDLDRARGYVEDEDDTPDELKGYQLCRCSASHG